MWLSVLPPPTTARPYLVFGGYNQLPMQVHNDGRGPVRSDLQIELASEHGMLASGHISCDCPPGTSQTLVWHASLPSRNELAGQLAQLRVNGQVNGEALAPIDLPIRLVRSKGIEFLANKSEKTVVKSRGPPR